MENEGASPTGLEKVQEQEAVQEEKRHLQFDEADGLVYIDKIAHGDLKGVEIGKDLFPVRVVPSTVADDPESKRKEAEAAAAAEVDKKVNRKGVSMEGGER